MILSKGLRFRGPSGFLALVIISVMVMPSCGDDAPKVRGVSGRNLEIHAGHPLVVDQAFFESEEGTKIIVPSASNRQLVVLEVDVVNRTSTVIPLMVDPEAVKIGDRRGKRYEAVNPFEKSKNVRVAPEESLRVKNIAPLLWDDTELPRNYQVGGYIVFDVPKGLLLGTLFWDEIEYIPVDFIDYWKNRD